MGAGPLPDHEPVPVGLEGARCPLPKVVIGGLSAEGAEKSLVEGGDAKVADARLGPPASATSAAPRRITSVAYADFISSEAAQAVTVAVARPRYPEPSDRPQAGTRIGGWSLGVP